MALAFKIIATVDSKAVGGGPHKLVLADITCDGAYAGGGYAVTAANFNLTAIDAVIVGGVGATGAGNTGLDAHWDRASGKIKLYKNTNAATALTEAAGGDVSTADIISVMVVGQ